MSSIAEKLQNVRQEMIAARIRVAQVVERVEFIEALAALDAQGKNETERKANARLRLAEREDYTRAKSDLVVAQRYLDALKVDEEFLTDERRAQEWAIRLRLAEALAGRGAAIGEPAADETLLRRLDDAPADEAATRAAQEAQAAPLPSNYLDDVELPARPTYQTPPRAKQPWAMPSADIPLPDNSRPAAAPPGPAQARSGASSTTTGKHLVSRAQPYNPDDDVPF